MSRLMDYLENTFILNLKKYGPVNAWKRAIEETAELFDLAA